MIPTHKEIEAVVNKNRYAIHDRFDKGDILISVKDARNLLALATAYLKGELVGKVEVMSEGEIVKVLKRFAVDVAFEDVSDQVDTILSNIAKALSGKIPKAQEVNRELLKLAQDILEWDGILLHSKIRIRQVIDHATALQEEK